MYAFQYFATAEGKNNLIYNSTNYYDQTTKQPKSKEGVSERRETQELLGLLSQTYIIFPFLPDVFNHIVQLVQLLQSVFWLCVHRDQDQILYH